MHLGAHSVQRDVVGLVRGLDGQLSQILNVDRLHAVIPSPSYGLGGGSALGRCTCVRVRYNQAPMPKPNHLSPKKQVEQMIAAVRQVRTELAASPQGPILRTGASTVISCLRQVVAAQSSVKLLLKQARTSERAASEFLNELEQTLATTIALAARQNNLPLFHTLWRLAETNDFIGDPFFYAGLKPVLEATLRATEAGEHPVQALLFAVLINRPKRGTFDTALSSTLGWEALAQHIVEVLDRKHTIDKLPNDVVFFIERNRHVLGYLAVALFRKLAECLAVRTAATPIAKTLTHLYTDRNFETFARSLGCVLYCSNLHLLGSDSFEEFRSSIESRLFGPYEDLARKELSHLLRLIVRLKASAAEELERIRQGLDEQYRRELEERVKRDLEQAVTHAVAREQQRSTALQVDLFTRLAELEAVFESWAQDPHNASQRGPDDISHIRCMIQNLYASHGVEKIGHTGEITRFDPKVHEPLAAKPMSANVPVEIVRPGLALYSSAGQLRLVIRKAEVNLAEP